MKTAAFDDIAVQVWLTLGYQTAQLHDVLLLYLIIIQYYKLFTLQCSAVVSCSVAAAAVHLAAAQQF